MSITTKTPNASNRDHALTVITTSRNTKMDNVNLPNFESTMIKGREQEKYNSYSLTAYPQQTGAPLP